MDRQRTYERVRDHLLTQMEVSEDSGTGLYRGPRGLKCAIGALIPDELMKSEFNHRSVDRLCGGYYPEITKHLGVEDENDVSFLEGLQRVHDHRKLDDEPRDAVAKWPERLKAFALAHSLVP